MRSEASGVSWPLRRWLCGVLSVLIGTAWTPAMSSALAQSVVVEGPTTNPLPSITPSLTVRANGFASVRPLRVRVQLSTASDFALSAILVDSTFTTGDTIVPVQITRILPSDAVLYWKGSVQGTNGAVIESAITGPRTVPSWLVLVTPNSPTGDILDSRVPPFTWRSARILPTKGPWSYSLEITSAGRPEQGTAGITDTTFRFTTGLQANTSYRWSVRASLPSGESIRVASIGTFVIIDPPLPTSTILYQNFPNPFPSANAFNTCFWFDVGGAGGKVSLDVLDLRGNIVRTIIPGADRIGDFPAGRYGRGAPGAGSNCDNRYIWDGIASDGRVVSAGVYLARFRVGNAAPTYRRILFTGR